MSDGNITAGNGNHKYLREKINLLADLYPESISTIPLLDLAMNMILNHSNHLVTSPRENITLLIV